LTLRVKMGYNIFMFANAVSFVLRLCLIAAVWAFIWRFVEPRTQRMRILRAALLVLGLLFVLGVVRITSP
jgi:membrane protein DedA with SNARE-associated domain